MREVWARGLDYRLGSGGISWGAGSRGRSNTTCTYIKAFPTLTGGLLRSRTCGLLPMYSPLTALTLTAYILTRTATRLPMLTDRLTYDY
jgi:hypothetical protein